MFTSTPMRTFHSEPRILTGRSPVWVIMSFSHVKWLALALVLNYCWASGNDTESDKVMQDLKHIQSLVTSIESRLANMIKEKVKNMSDDITHMNKDKEECNCSYAEENTHSPPLSLNPQSDEDFLRFCADGDLDNVTIAMDKIGVKKLSDIRDSDGQPGIILAVRGDHHHVISYLLSQGWPVDQLDRDGYTALHWASGKCRTPSMQSIQALLEAGANVDAKSNSGDEPIHLATLSGCTKVVQHLLRAGVNVNAKGRNDWTPLHYAANEAKSDMICLFISNGASLYSISTEGVTPLILAESRNATDVVRLLKEPEKCIVKLDHEGFLSACMNGDMEVVKEFMNGRSIADTIGVKRYNNSCLHLSTMRGREDVVSYLLTQGWPVNQKGSFSATALHFSGYFGHPSTSTLLLEAGANLNAMEIMGNKPIHSACVGGSLDVVSILFKAGARIEDKGRNGMTPLHIAVGMNHDKVVRYLIEKGADKTAQDDERHTPLELAKKWGFYNVIQILEE